MKKQHLIAVALALAVIPVAPALAGWKLVEQGAATPVAKSTLTVTAGEQWNRWSVRPIKKGEIWTLDGIQINELYFVSGLVGGEPLYREANKKEAPLPKFSAQMQLTDIPELFESSNRLALNTSMFQITGTEPTTFGSGKGVKFTYKYAVNGSPVERKGVAAAIIAGGKLYLISFTAIGRHFYERDRAKAEAIMASAKF
jgi:hypothetical protein